MAHDDGLAGLHDDVGKGRNPRVGFVQDAAHELADGGLLLAIDVSPRHVAQMALLVHNQHVAVVTQPRQRQMHGAIERFLVVERRSEQRADLGQEREAIARGHRFGERAAAVGNVASDLRCADDPARRILDRRHRDRHVDSRSVLAHATGFEVLHWFAGHHARERAFFFGSTVRRDHQRDRLAQRFLRRVSVQTLGAPIPRRDDAD